MKSIHNLLNGLLHLWRADFLSPKDLIRRAAVIAILFLVVHAAGLRDFTSVLSGTPGSDHLSWRTSAFLGVAYIVVYLGFVLLVPVFLLAAAILTLGRRMLQLRGHRPRHYDRQPTELASPHPVPDSAVHSGPGA